jgi:hypothetical protein
MAFVLPMQLYGKLPYKTTAALGVFCFLFSETTLFLDCATETPRRRPKKPVSRKCPWQCLDSSDPAPSPATGERIGGMHLNRLESVRPPTGERIGGMHLNRLESVRPPTGERPFQADAHPQFSR